MNTPTKLHNTLIEYGEEILLILVWISVTISIFALTKVMKKVLFAQKYDDEKCKIYLMFFTMTLSQFLGVIITSLGLVADKNEDKLCLLKDSFP